MTRGKGTEPELWENQIKIASDEVRIGHHVAMLSSSWAETPFLLQGFVIADQSELEWIHQHCDWAVIDLKKSESRPEPQPEPQSTVRQPEKVRKEALLSGKPLTQASLKASLSKYLNLTAETQRIIEHFKDLDPIDVRKTIFIIRDIAMSLTDNLPALIWLTRIKHRDQYTAEHCLNVSVLAMGLGSALGWEQREVAQVGVAGLLHDLGKIDIDDEILNKSGQLTPGEYAEMKRHSQLGYDRLHDEPDLTSRILLGIRDHHERPDGLGYPRGLSGDDIDDMAKIVCLVDAYDAITSNRVYQQARSHHDAMSILWRMRGTQFDTRMVEAFIQFMGWVTPGTLVQLSSGDLAVVINAVSGQRLYPKVRVLMPTNNGFRLGAEWDLSVMQAFENGEKIHISEVKPDGYLGICVEDYTDNLICA